MGFDTLVFWMDGLGNFNRVFVSSIHNISMEFFDNISLRLMIFSLKDFVVLIRFSKIYQTINVRIKIACLMWFSQSEAVVRLIQFANLARKNMQKICPWIIPLNWLELLITNGNGLQYSGSTWSTFSTGIEAEMMYVLTSHMPGKAWIRL